MSSQTIYFNNPADITNLQTTTTSMSGAVNNIKIQSGLTTIMDIPKTLQGITTYAIGGPIGAPYTGSPAVSGTTAFVRVTTGTGASQDATGKNCFGYACVVGNAFSGQEIFYTTGAADSAGNPYVYDQTLLLLASTAKFYNSCIWLKMLDERLISLSDTPFTMGLTAWTGTYQYYLPASGTYVTTTTTTTILSGYTGPNDITGYTGAFTGPYGATVSTSTSTSRTSSDLVYIGGATGAYNSLTAATLDFSSWTGPRGTGSLSELTFAQLISGNLAFPHPNSFSAANITAWTTAPTTAQKTTVDWGWNNCLKDTYLAYQNAINIGSASGAIAAGNAWWTWDTAAQCRNFSFMTGPVTDSLTTALNCIKNGTIALGWRVGAEKISPYTDIKEQNFTYGRLNYDLLGAMCSLAAIRAGYSSLYDYLNKKILIPMEITSNDLYIYNYNNKPVGINQAETSCRRTQVQSSGTWLGPGADPKLYDDGILYQTSAGATGYAFNRLYWISQYPNDSMFNWPNTAFFDPLGWTLGHVVTCNFKSWAKIIKTYINRGIYVNSSGQNVRILSRKIWDFSQNTCRAMGSWLGQYAGYTNTSSQSRWIVAQAQKFSMDDNLSDIAFTAVGGGDWYGANTATSSTLLTSGMIQWSGSQGSTYIFDINSGYYILEFNSVANLGNNAKALGNAALLPYICEL